MISVKSLLYGLDMKLNKLATNDHQEIPLENKIIALNKNQIRLLKLRIDENNIYKLGFDSFKKRYQDLEGLIEPYNKHELTPTLTDPQLQKWSVDISNLTPKYMFYVDSYALAEKGVCKKHLIYVNKDLAKHADVTVLLGNNHIKPSFEYQETFCTLSSGSYEIYGDEHFKYTSVFLSYIRYPKEIDFEGYIHLDGSDSVTQDCELPAYMEDELLDLAVQDLAFSTENMAAAAASQSRQDKNE